MVGGFEGGMRQRRSACQESGSRHNCSGSRHSGIDANPAASFRRLNSRHVLQLSRREHKLKGWETRKSRWERNDSHNRRADARDGIGFLGGCALTLKLRPPEAPPPKTEA